MSDRILARLLAGEEIIQSLKGLARAESIPSASLTALGAVGDLTLALFDPARRAYLETRFEEDLEISSMVGDVSWFGGEPVIHAHAVASRADCSVVAGHVMRGIVSVTLEVMLTIYPDRIERRSDPRFGLNLLDLA